MAAMCWARAIPGVPYSLNSILAIRTAGGPPAGQRLPANADGLGEPDQVHQYPTEQLVVAVAMQQVRPEPGEAVDQVVLSGLRHVPLVDALMRGVEAELDKRGDALVW